MAIFAIGSTVFPSLEAAERLSASGIRAAVVNARFVKPLDAELICRLGEGTGKILTVEENVLEGGFGSALLELLQERGFHGVEVRRLGIPGVFVEHGSRDQLRERYRLDGQGICHVVLEWMRPAVRQKSRATLLDLKKVSS
jgi:1-deoxy-D-xylulose-5-phosphate synthase